MPLLLSASEFTLHRRGIGKNLRNLQLFKSLLTKHLALLFCFFPNRTDTQLLLRRYPIVISHFIAARLRISAAFYISVL